MPRLPVEEDRLHMGVSNFFIIIIILLMIFFREGRQVCKACTTAKQQCAMVGGDMIKVSWKKTEDMEEESSSGKKWKRKEEDEIEAEFRLVVEELWGWIVRRWEELEQWQEQRWAAMVATLEHITDDVQYLLDGLVPEEKEKGKEIGVEMDVEEMETEETGEAEEAEESGETGAGTEKDRDGEMEVEETLKEMEKWADEAGMEE